MTGNHGERASVRDRQVSLNAVLAVVCWVVGSLLTGATFWLGLGVGIAGLLVTTAAAVLTVRGFLIGRNSREEEAFNLGQSSAGKVRKLRD